MENCLKKPKSRLEGFMLRKKQLMVAVKWLTVEKFGKCVDRKDYNEWQDFSWLHLKANISWVAENRWESCFIAGGTIEIEDKNSKKS